MRPFTANARSAGDLVSIRATVRAVAGMGPVGGFHASGARLRPSAA